MSKQRGALHFLSNEYGLIDDFNKKYELLANQDKELINSVIEFSNNYGTLTTFYVQGMARKTTPERVKRLLVEVFGKKSIEYAKLILLTGSKKPFSDIDVFIVANDFPEITFPWLDIQVFSQQEYEAKLKLFDIEISDPLLTGELISGDPNLLSRYQDILKTQHITPEAINYNLEESTKQRNLALQYSENSDERRIGLSYCKTYLKNSLELKNGNRILKKDLLLSNN